MMMTRSLALAALVFGASIAHAQPAPAPAPTPAPAPDAAGAGAPTPAPAPAPGPQTDEQKRAQAKALYEQGLSAYNLGNFDEAIKVFSEAYALSQAPGLLFNIAQSHRLKKDYERATYFYTTYLRLKPDAPNRADVEARLDEMKKFIEEQKNMERKPPEGVMNPDQQTTTDQVQPVITGPVDKGDPDAAKKAQKLMMIGIVTGGSGVALVITGLVFGKLARNAESDLNKLNNNGMWTSAQQDRYDAGKRNNAIAIITLVAGSAAIVTGGTFYVLGMLKKKEATVAINPTAGGTAVAVGWSF